MNSKKLNQILAVVRQFAISHSQIVAVALCGSQARGTARPDSDIDLSILVEDQQLFKNTDWIAQIDFKKIDEKIASFRDAAYGTVWSRHVFLESGTEIEFSFANRSWADIDPIDGGTKKVVSDGYKVLHDPHQILIELLAQLNTNP